MTLNGFPYIKQNIVLIELLVLNTSLNLFIFTHALLLSVKRFQTIIKQPFQKMILRKTRITLTLTSPTN